MGITFLFVLYLLGARGVSSSIESKHTFFSFELTVKPSSQIVLIGKSFHIKCSVSIPVRRTDVVMGWSYTSNKSPYDTKRGNISKTGQNTNLTALAMSTRIRIVKPEIEPLYPIETIYVENTTMTDGGVYRCTFKDRKIIKFDDAEVRVIDKPFVTLKPLKTGYITKEGSKQAVMEVKFDAHPKPKFEWYKDNRLISTPESVSIGEIRVQYAIKFPNRTHAGNYILKAYTTDQNAFITMELIVESNPSTSQGTNQGSMAKYVIIGVCVVCVVLIVVIIVIVCVYRKRSEKMHKELEKSLLQTKVDYNPEIPIDQQASCIPYDAKWEFPKERLRLGMVLGQGAFGRVIKAVATEIVKHEAVTCVAVKMVKDCTDRKQMMSLLSELKIFIHIGQHLNVLSLLGAVTKNIAKGELYVIVEYCHFGNLRNYLIKNKDTYKDIVSDKAKQMPNYVNKVQPDNTNDLVGPPLTKKNLISWAFQVSRGMEYLASKKCIHRDLAARNVLLAEDNVLKICDFGLSKDCYKYAKQEYHQKGDGLMPIKWTALESLTHKIYTTKSDVWSYGVFLWELFALGGSPYPGVEFNEKFITLLKDGYRMEKPEAASDDIYEVMRSCWAENPNDRPTFSHLVDKIGDFLEHNVKQYYLDLGKSDFKMNNLEPDSATGHDEPLMQDGYLKMNSLSGDNTNNTKMTYPAPPPDGAIGLSSGCDNEDKDGYVRVPKYETKENGDNIELQSLMPTTVADDQAQMHENQERRGKYLRENSSLLMKTPADVHRVDNDSASGHSSNATGSSLEKLYD